MRYVILLVLAALGAAPALAQTPGTLIAADPVVETPGGAQAWKIRYWTLSDRETPIEVTGMVVAPREAIPARPRRVIAWTHGTWGVNTACAPSLSPNFFGATPALSEMIASGYTVVAADYPGLGSAMPHPYLVGLSTGRSVLDAVRAARRIPGAAAGSEFAVWGESQGGHAALWTGELAATYAPDLRLVGVAAAAPPTDLSRNLRESSDPSAKAFFTALIAESWSQHYGIPLRGIGKRRTPGLIERLARKCISLDSKPKFATLLGILALRSDLRSVDLSTRQPWGRYARLNSVGRRSPGAPVLIAQAVADPLVAPAVTRAFARDLCGRRESVRWIDIPGNSHPTSAADSAAPTLSWIADRFAGRRAPSDCRKI